MHNTLGDLLHHRPLLDGHMKVSVDVALDLDALLPVPDIVSEMIRYVENHYESLSIQLTVLTLIFYMVILDSYKTRI